jgi:hypothetical protein
MEKQNGLATPPTRSTGGPRSRNPPRLGNEHPCRSTRYQPQPLILTGDLNDTVQAATTQMLLRPPGSEIKTADSTHPTKATDNDSGTSPH